MRVSGWQFLLIASLSSGHASLFYEVEPQAGSWQETVLRGYFSQVISCSFDSLTRADVFLMVRDGFRRCRLEVLEFPGGRRIALSEPVSAAQGGRWLTFERWIMRERMTRGRRYEFRFAWDGGPIGLCFVRGDSLSAEEPLIVNGIPDRSSRLSLRIRGAFQKTSAAYFGTVPGFPAERPGWAEPWAMRMRESGMKAADLSWYWDLCRPNGPDGWVKVERHEDQLVWLRDSLSLEVVARPQLCPPWASTRIESIPRVGRDTIWSNRCAPRNLYAEPSDDTNYWARFISELVDMGIHEWEIWNEPNDTCVSSLLHVQGIDGWWRRPNTHYHVERSARGLCSLYVRLVAVAAGVIRNKAGHADDLILAGSVHRVTSGTSYLVPGLEWMRLCYEVAGEHRAWNGVAVHPYQDSPVFDPLVFDAEAESVRSVMVGHGDYGQLRITEMGWPFVPDQPHVQAYNLCKAYVSAAASVGLPLGGYDGMTWYCLQGDERFGLLSPDSAMTPRPAFFALAWVGRVLGNSRFVRRRLAGTMLDETMRLYEFESGGRSFWVGWTHGRLADDGDSAEARIPVYSDVLSVTALPLDVGQCSRETTPAADGWFRVKLSERPVFVVEKGRRNRPDLVVDSVRVEPREPEVGQRLVMSAWVRNRRAKDTRATPAGFPTRVVFLAEGDTLGQEFITRSIAPGQAVRVDFVLSSEEPVRAGPCLFKVVANPEQRYVELDMTNNAGYLVAEVR